MTTLQKRLRAKVQTKDAKLEVLLMQWDRIVQRIKKSNRRGKLDDFIDQIRLIDPAVKEAAMAEYLRRVRTKYMVAFS